MSFERCWLAELSCWKASHFVMYSVSSITTRATPFSVITMMWSLSFLRFSSAKYPALVVFVCINFIGVSVKNSFNIMVESTAVKTIECTCLESCHSTSGDVFFDGDGC